MSDLSETQLKTENEKWDSDVVTEESEITILTKEFDDEEGLQKEKNEDKLSKGQWMTTIFVIGVLWIGYIQVYLSAFSMLPITMPLMIKQGDYTLGDMQNALLITRIIRTGFKFFSGFIVDLLGGYVSFIVSGLLVGTCTIAIGFFGVIGWNEAWLFTIMYCLQQVFTICCWGAVMKIATKWVSYKYHGRLGSILATAYLFGDVISRAVLSVILYWNNWKLAYIFGGTMFCLITTFIFMFIRNSPTQFFIPNILPLMAFLNFGFVEPAEPPESIIEKKEMAKSAIKAMWETIINMAKLLLKLVTQFEFLLCLIWYGALSFCRYVYVDLMSYYLVENFGMDSGTAGMATAIFPLSGGIAGVCLGNMIDVFKGNKTKQFLTIIVVHSVGVLALLALLLIHFFMDPYQYPPSPYLVGCVLSLIGIVGVGIIGPYTVVSFFSMRFGGAFAVATISSVFDSFGIIMSMSSVLGMQLVESMGFRPAWGILTALTLVADAIAMACMIVLYLKHYFISE